MGDSNEVVRGRMGFAVRREGRKVGLGKEGGRENGEWPDNPPLFI